MGVFATFFHQFACFYIPISFMGIRVLDLVPCLWLGLIFRKNESIEKLSVSVGMDLFKHCLSFSSLEVTLDLHISWSETSCWNSTLHTDNNATMVTQWQYSPNIWKPFHVPDNQSKNPFQRWKNLCWRKGATVSVIYWHIYWWVLLT